MPLVSVIQVISVLMGYALFHLYINSVWSGRQLRVKKEKNKVQNTDFYQIAGISRKEAEFFEHKYEFKVLLNMSKLHNHEEN